MKQLLRIIVVLLLPALAQAADVLPFDRGALARIKTERAQRAFILTTWSSDCPHCKQTLRQLRAFAKVHPRTDLVIVCTDNGIAPSVVAHTLRSVGFERQRSWAFDGDAEERLRFEIDPHWGGELPRTYLFDRRHQASAFSGPIPAAALDRWLAAAGG